METGSIALVGGRVLTLDPKNPAADALLIEEGRITAVGKKEDIEKRAKAMAVPTFDLAGKTVVPGFHDCHVHVMGTGLNATGIDLYDAGSIKGVLSLIEEAGRQAGEDFIYGTRLDESRLLEKRPPTAAEIDAVAGDRGVFLVDRGLHYTLVNTAAYKKIGFTGEEPGIMRGEDGQVNGRLHGKANALARTYFNAKMSDAQREAAIRHVAAEAVKKGVTTIHGMEGGEMFCDADIPVFLKLREDLPLDILVYWDTPDLDAIEAAGLKRMGTDLLLDGSVGSRTAAFDAPYADDPTTCGVLYFEREDTEAMVTRAMKDGIQSGFHAIGQRGIRFALDTLEHALAQAPREDHRFRIEHFGFPDESDIKRAKRCGAIISTQPAFTYLRGGQGSVYNLRTGDERERRAYALRHYIDAGLILCGGSDSGVTPIDPVLGIHAAVNPPYPENGIQPEEALAMFTINGAYSAFEENMKGSLELGKWGDVTILSDNPLTVAPETIKDIVVEGTITRGKMVYRLSENKTDTQ